MFFDLTNVSGRRILELIDAETWCPFRNLVYVGATHVYIPALNGVILCTPENLQQLTQNGRFKYIV